MKKNEEKKAKGVKRMFVLVAELAALVALISAAFFAPQIVFGIQDYLLCANTSLSKRETLDVEALGTTYEKSLNQRIMNYMDGLEAGENYYVAEQVLEINQEVYDFLSDNLYHDIVLTYVDIGVIPIEFYKLEYTVTQWKRYVIYSENYDKGVSFILWYIELQDSMGAVMKLLADGEDGTIYALKTENNGLLEQSGGDAGKNQNASYNGGIVDWIWIIYEEGYLAELWGRYTLYYEAMSRVETDVYIKEYLEQEEEYLEDEAVLAKDVRWEIETFDYDSEGCRIRFYLPYGEERLEVLVEISNVELGLKYITYRSPDFTMGIRQIYEKIPEFA